MRAPVRLAAASIAALSLSAGPAAVEASAATNSASYESAVVKYTNKERVEKDRHKVKGSSCVDGFAEAQARAMATAHSMYHQDLGPILDECGLSTVGENVGYGYPDGKAVTKAWMRSDGHRANILRSQYRLIGVGAVKDDRGVWYVSQVFGRKA